MANAQKGRKKALTVSFSITVVAIISGTLLALYLIRGVTGPMKKTVELAEAMSTRDFTQQADVDRGDEVSVLVKALNGMATSLGGMIQQISSGVVTLSTSSNDLSGISGQMSAGADQTAGNTTN